MHAELTLGVVLPAIADKIRQSITLYVNYLHFVTNSSYM